MTCNTDAFRAELVDLVLKYTDPKADNNCMACIASALTSALARAIVSHTSGNIITIALLYNDTIHDLKLNLVSTTKQWNELMKEELHNDAGNPIPPVSQEHH